MIATFVLVDVKPEHVEEFRAITAYNYENTRKEAGNVRFDILQSNEDLTKFTMYEVFENEDAVKFHKTTAHYLRWRETVAPFMATPRRAIATTPVCFD